MSDDTLPPLPEPWDYCYEWDGPYGSRKFSAAKHNGNSPDRSVPIYTAGQMHAYGQLCADAAIERCAQVCEAERIKRPIDARGDAYNKALEDAAASILALKGQPT